MSDRAAQTQVRVAAAKWATALLESRPEDTQDECDEFAQTLQRHAAQVPPDASSALWRALERDDEDTAETARLVFEQLSKPWWRSHVRPTKDEVDLVRSVEQEAEYGNPLDEGECRTRHGDACVDNCSARGWVRVEDGAIWLTEDGHQMLAAGWGR